MPSLRVVSADSHMMEPPDLWTLALEKKYGDRTPQVKKTSKGFLFVAPGVRPFAVAGGFGAGRSGKELKEHLTPPATRRRVPADGTRWSASRTRKSTESRPRCSTPLLGMPLFGLDDTELQRACFAVYNDWVAEFCSTIPSACSRSR